MKKLEHHLAEWVDGKLISAEQAESIKQHEQNKQSKSWIAYGFLFLGATIVVIGVISVIAANWYQIPDAVKLLVDFAMLAGLAYSVYATIDREKKYVFEVLLTVFVLSVFATIGLISQVYHMGGKLYEAIFLWALITLPAVLFSKRIYLPYLWAMFFVGSGCFMVAGSSHLKLLFRGPEMANWSFVFLCLPLFNFLTATILNVFRKESIYARIFRELTILSGLISVFYADIMVSSGGFRHGLVSNTTGDGVSFILLFCVPAFTMSVAAIIILFRQKMLNYNGRVLASAIIFFHLAVFSIMTFIGSFSGALVNRSLDEILGAFVGVLMLILASLLAGVLAKKKIFRVLVAILGIRFLIIYFQAMGGLAATGAGLIISGLIILLTVYAWIKTRGRVEAMAERLGRK